MGGVTAELRPGGIVIAGEAERPVTGGWRTGGKPVADLERCVNCLLCWVYCPDAAVIVEGGVFAGFDLEVCKGCAICAEMCPIGAVELVEEDGDEG